jgi:uncharacterized membrane protein YjdF
MVYNYIYIRIIIVLCCSTYTYINVPYADDFVSTFIQVHFVRKTKVKSKTYNCEAHGCMMPLPTASKKQA